MKKIFNIILAALAVGSLAVSCLKEGESLASSVTADKTELLPFEAAGSEEQVIKVTADGEWVAGAPSWIVLSTYAGSGNAEITVSPRDNYNDNNEMLAPREGVITIGGANGSCVVSVRQRGDKGKLLVILETVTVKQFLDKSEDKDVFYHLSGTITSWYTNGETYGNFYMVDAANDTILVYGLTKTKQAKNDQSFGSLNLTIGSAVSLAGYRSSYNGTAQVGGGYVYDPEKQNVQISPESYEAAIDTGDFVLDIISRGTYTVTSDDWIICEAPDADHKVKVHVKKNTGVAPRTGKVTVTATVGATVQAVECKINQMCNEPATITPVADVMTPAMGSTMRLHGTVVMSTGGKNGYILGENGSYVYVYYNNSYAVGDSVKVVGKSSSYADAVCFQFAPYFDQKLGNGKFRASNPEVMDATSLENYISGASSTNLMNAKYVKVEGTIFDDGGYANAKNLAGGSYGARLYLGKNVDLKTDTYLNKSCNLYGWIVGYESNKTRVRLFLEKAEPITEQ
ncbi:MAG: BACON domain-containing protein [Bacteroidales bacterium]|nr:BACON domain-containing protein [Bacteroidales bacterium]